MDKRGQVAVFIIIGILILVVFGVISMLQQSNQSVQHSEQEELQQQALMVQKYVSACIEQKLAEAEDLGLKEELTVFQEAYINEKLKECADFSAFESNGIRVESGKIETEVRLSDQVLAATVKFPMTIRKGESSITLSNFYQYIKRETTAKLTQDQGMVAETKIIPLGDSKAELKIPAGTAATKDGELLGEIKLNILDRNFETLDNKVVVGGVVYEGLPEGATFSPAIELSIKYDPEKIKAEGIRPETLTIAYYDTSKDMWMSLESHVDTENNIVTAKIDHFSKYAIVASCSSKSEPQVLYLKESCENNVGSYEFIFKATKGSSCAGSESTLELDCGGCAVEIDGNKAEQKEGKYSIKKDWLKVAGEPNKITTAKCTGKTAILKLSGTGAIIENCNPGTEKALYKNCKCGTNHFNPAYDNDGDKFLNFLKGKDYNELTHDQLKPYLTEEKVCVNGEIKDKQPAATAAVKCEDEVYKLLLKEKPNPASEELGIGTGEDCENGEYKQNYMKCVNGEWKLNKQVVTGKVDKCPEKGTECDPKLTRHRRATTTADRSTPRCDANPKGEKVEIWEKCQNGKWVQYPTETKCGTNWYCKTCKAELPNTMQEYKGPGTGTGGTSPATGGTTPPATGGTDAQPAKKCDGKCDAADETNCPQDCKKTIDKCDKLNKLVCMDKQEWICTGKDKSAVYVTDCEKCADGVGCTTTATTTEGCNDAHIGKTKCKDNQELQFCTQDETSGAFSWLSIKCSAGCSGDKCTTPPDCNSGNLFKFKCNNNIRQQCTTLIGIKADAGYTWNDVPCKQGVKCNHAGECEASTSAPQQQQPAKPAPPAAPIAEIPEGYSPTDLPCGQIQYSFCGTNGKEEKAGRFFSAVRKKPETTSLLCLNKKWHEKDCNKLGGCDVESGRCRASIPNCPANGRWEYVSTPDRNNLCTKQGFVTCADKDANNFGTPVYCDQYLNACSLKEPCECGSNNECSEAALISSCNYFGDDCGMGARCCPTDKYECARPLGLTPKGVCTTKSKTVRGCSREGQPCDLGGGNAPDCCKSDNTQCIIPSIGEFYGRCVKKSTVDGGCRLSVAPLWAAYTPDCSDGLECVGWGFKGHCEPKEISSTSTPPNPKNSASQCKRGLIATDCDCGGTIAKPGQYCCSQIKVNNGIPSKISPQPCEYPDCKEGEVITKQSEAAKPACYCGENLMYLDTDFSHDRNICCNGKSAKRYGERATCPNS